MKATSFIDAYLASARRGRLLLFLCCLLSLLPAIAAYAQAPAAHLLWKQSCFTGQIAYSPTQPLIAATQGFGEIALLRPDGAVARTIRSEQTDIRSLVFAPDGQTLASGSNDKTVKLWRVRDGACLRMFNHDLPVWCVAFAPNGQTLAVNSAGSTDLGNGSFIHHENIKLWRVSDGACQQTITDDKQYMNSMAFTADGQTLFYSSGDTIKLWSVRDGACLQTFPGQSMALTPDGQMLAVCNRETNKAKGKWSINLWRVRDGACLRTITVHEDVESMAFDPDGQTLAVCNGESSYYMGKRKMSINLWRVRDGVCLQTITLRVDSIALAFAPDGQTLAAYTEELDNEKVGGSIKLWRVRDGACLWTIIVNPSGVSSTTIAFAPDGQTLASGSYGSIKLWNVHDGTCLHTFTNPANDANFMAFTPDGQTLTSSDGVTIKLWCVRDGTCLQTFTGPIIIGTDYVHMIDKENVHVALAPDGKTLASSVNDKTIKLWRVGDGACLRTITVHENVDSMAFAPDGQTLAVCDGYSSGWMSMSKWRGNIDLWRIRDGACLQILKGLTSYVHNLAFAPDGQTLASSNEVSIKLWRVRDGACLQTISQFDAYALAFAPDGQTLASGGSYGVQLWQVRDGACLWNHPAQGTNGALRSVAFTPDGQILACGGGEDWGSADGFINIWRVRDGACLQSITGQVRPVSIVAFAADGHTLGSGGMDGIALWSLTGR